MDWNMERGKDILDYLEKRFSYNKEIGLFHSEMITTNIEITYGVTFKSQEVVLGLHWTL